MSLFLVALLSEFYAINEKKIDLVNLWQFSPFSYVPYYSRAKRSEKNRNKQFVMGSNNCENLALSNFDYVLEKLLRVRKNFWAKRLFLNKVVTAIASHWLVTCDINDWYLWKAKRVKNHSGRQAGITNDGRFDSEKNEKKNIENKKV